MSVQLERIPVRSLMNTQTKAVTNSGKAPSELTGRTFHKIKGYPDFTIAFDYDDDLFHIFNNDTEIATCDIASEAKRIVKTS